MITKIGDKDKDLWAKVVLEVKAISLVRDMEIKVFSKDQVSTKEVLDLLNGDF